jgi:hypothetical protein
MGVIFGSALRSIEDTISRRIKLMLSRTVYAISFEHIDFKHSITDADELSELHENGLLPCSRENASRVFTDAGWEGDGTIEVFWIPPFMFESPDSTGIFLWHVKQNNNGTSWLCVDEPYEFPGLGSHKRWQSFQVSEPEKPTPF